MTAANRTSGGPGRLRPCLGLAAGMVISTLTMMVWLGPRPDLDQAMRSTVFWINILYALTLAVLGFVILMRQIGDGADGRQPYAALAGPVVALTVLAGIQISAPGANSTRLLMGDSWALCSWLITLLSLPPLAGLLLGLRDPARPGRTGAVAGLVAGAGAAVVYTFHGSESAAPFILVWYTLGIAVCALFGAFLGTKMMR